MKTLVRNRALSPEQLNHFLCDADIMLDFRPTAKPELAFDPKDSECKSLLLHSLKNAHYIESSRMLAVLKATMVKEMIGTLTAEELSEMWQDLKQQLSDCNVYSLDDSAEYLSKVKQSKRKEK